MGLHVLLLVHICDVEALPAKESQQIQQAAKEKHSPALCVAQMLLQSCSAMMVSQAP